MSITLEQIVTSTNYFLLLALITFDQQTPGSPSRSIKHLKYHLNILDHETPVYKRLRWRTTDS